MKVLITNTRLDRRGGSEVVVQLLARHLQARGHTVMAYTGHPNEVRRLLDLDSVPVVNDIKNLTFAPDIIHGQHHLDTMSAIAALPESPALFHSHGGVWKDALPFHPRIYKYLAISRFMAERHQIECNLSPSQIEVLLNGIDVSKFHTVRELPPHPKKALLYNRIFHLEHPLTKTIRNACARHNINLDVIGLAAGNKIDKPEEVLPSYDIVFASGLSAMDAIASGCAVISIGRTSCGAMVTPDNFDHYREANFLTPANSNPATTEKISGELARFSPESSQTVTRRLREEADFNSVVDRLVDIYESIITQHQSTNPDYEKESVALSAYLRMITPLIKVTDRSLNWDTRLPTDTFDSLCELRSRIARVKTKLDDVL
ncbi:MAG: glycosyltransferase [Verrucomicrobiota bacterium]